MKWEKGKSPNPGGSKSLSARKLTAAAKEILEGKSDKTYHDLIHQLLDHAFQTEDRSVSLKAITLLWERIEGRIPFAKEEKEFAETLGQTMAATLFELRHQQAEEADGHIAKMKEVAKNGSGGGGVHALPMAQLSNDV